MPGGERAHKGTEVAQLPTVGITIIDVGGVERRRGELDTTKS